MGDLHPTLLRKLVDEYYGEPETAEIDRISLAQEAIRMNPKKVRFHEILTPIYMKYHMQAIQVANLGSKPHVTQLAHGIECLPVQYRKQAVRIFVKAFRQGADTWAASNVCSLMGDAIPLLVALHKLGQRRELRTAEFRRQLFGLWPILLPLTQRVARAIVRDEDDCPSHEAMIYFIMISFHLYSLLGSNEANPVYGREVSLIVISVWMHSYNTTIAQHHATELMVHNYASVNSCGVEPTELNEPNDEEYRAMVMEVANKVRLNPSLIVNMALKRLTRAVERASRFPRDTFHSDYHFTALAMLINPGHSTEISPFAVAFEGARGASIIGGVLNDLIDSDVQDRDLLTATVTTLGCAIQAATSLSTVESLLRSHLLRTLLELSYSLQMPSQDPRDNGRQGIQRNVIDTLVFHVLPPLLLFKSTLKLLEADVVEILQKRQISELFGWVAWRKFFTLYQTSVTANEVIGRLIFTGGSGCANVRSHIPAPYSNLIFDPPPLACMRRTA